MKPTADRIARSIAERFALGPPPIDVEALADALGVDEVVSADLVEDGRLERTDGTTRIVVRRGVSTQRRRFTIAHELGHLILNSPSSDVVATRHVIGEDREERFCEDFAAALLLPTGWIRPLAINRPRSLHTLRVIAGRSNTSLAAACVRLNEVAGWRRTLLHWSRVNERWAFDWAAGLPAGFDGRVRSADDTADVLDQVLRSGGDRRMSLPIRIGADRVCIDSQISVRHGSGLVLAQIEV